MAGGMDLGNSSKGGKKPLDTAINLVPFIDLMAVTIAFLIMTAVWTQIGRLQVSQSGNSSTEAEPPKDPLPPVTVLISDKELKVTLGGQPFDPIPVTRLANNKIDLTKLVAKLKEIKTQYPDQMVVTLQTEDAVRYDDLVGIIDQCIGAQFPSVSVAPAMG